LEAEMSRRTSRAEDLGVVKAAKVDESGMI
jgi:hypothetical protein